MQYRDGVIDPGRGQLALGLAETSAADVDGWGLPPRLWPTEWGIQDTTSLAERAEHPEGIPFAIPKRYVVGMATDQIAIRLPEPLLSDLDELVKSGAYPSRAEAVRAGIEAIVKLELQRRTDRAVIDGYTRQPPTETEQHAALASLREAILDEPW